MRPYPALQGLLAIVSLCAVVGAILLWNAGQVSGKEVLAVAAMTVGLMGFVHVSERSAREELAWRAHGN